MRTKRTDPHRPGAIVPADYECRVSYSLSTTDGGWPVPAIGIDCSRPYSVYGADGKFSHTVTPTCPDSGRCCVASAHRAAKAEGRAVFGAIGKCGVCGACFVYGTVFAHGPTSELVHMGHDCADKYEAMYDASAWELENGRQRAAVAKAIKAQQSTEEREAFLGDHPGLAAALEVEHPVIADIAARFKTYRELSEKQVELVTKIADEVLNPKPPAPEDVKIPGPLGKLEFRGTIVSAKVSEGEWGSSWKITVKVVVPGRETGGCWLAWGTAPRGLMDDVLKEIEADPERSRVNRETAVRDALRGRAIALRATLEAGREEHFRFMKRPTLVKGAA